MIHSGPPPEKPEPKTGIERTLGVEKERSLRSVTQTVRVDIRKLDHLMNIVGELAIVRSAFGRVAEKLRGEGQRKLAAELQRLHRNFDRRLGEMQDGILEVRMVPLGQVFDRLVGLQSNADAAAVIEERVALGLEPRQRQDHVAGLGDRLLV